MLFKDLKFAALISYSIIIFNILAGLLYTPWMVKTIGSDDFGIYILATTFLSYFVVDFGMFQSINKLISEYRAEANSDKIVKTISVATRIYLVWDILIIIVLTMLYYNLDSFFPSLTYVQKIKFKNVFLIASVFSVLNFPFSFIKGIMFAFEHIVLYKVYELMFKIVQIVAIFTALFFNGGLYWLVGVYALIPLIKNLFLTFILYKKGIRLNLKYWDKSIAKAILGISIWLFIYVLSELFINNFSSIIIVLEDSISSVAVFAIGFTVYGYFFQISNSISGFFLAKVSKLNYDGKEVDIKLFAQKVCRFQLFITGFIVFGIISSGSYFINAWMGNGFEDSYIIASLLVFPGLISFSQQVQQAQLYSKNKIYYHSLMMLLTAVSSISLSFLLVPTYGAIGAAIAISISNLVFMGIGMFIVYTRKLGFDARSNIYMYIKFIIGFIFVCVFSITLNHFFIEDFIFINIHWVRFLISAFIYTVIFASFTYYFLLLKDEKEALFKYLKKINNYVKK